MDGDFVIYTLFHISGQISLAAFHELHTRQGSHVKGVEHAEHSGTGAGHGSAKSAAIQHRLLDLLDLRMFGCYQRFHGVSHAACHMQQVLPLQRLKHGLRIWMPQTLLLIHLGKKRRRGNGEIRLRDAVEALRHIRQRFNQLSPALALCTTAENDLAYEEQVYQVAQLKHQQGNLSANALADAKDTYEAAKRSYASSKIDLFTTWLNYQNAVKYGVVSSGS